MSYTCEVSNILLSAFATWSFLFFTCILVLGALISFNTDASLGIIVNWVIDFYQNIFHPNLQKSFPVDVIHLV